MPRLDKGRTRVLCDGHETCRTEFGTIEESPEGRVFAYHVGWWPTGGVWDQGRIRRLPGPLRGTSVRALEQARLVEAGGIWRVCPRGQLRGGRSWCR